MNISDKIMHSRLAALNDDREINCVFLSIDDGFNLLGEIKSSCGMFLNLTVFWSERLELIEYAVSNRNIEAMLDCLSDSSFYGLRIIINHASGSSLVTCGYIYTASL
jgi:hypothetical protein